MASHEEDLMPENTSGYKISQPKQSLATYQQMGKSRSFLSFIDAPNRQPVAGQAILKSHPSQAPTTRSRCEAV